MANLIVDIGNTAVKAAWAEGMTLGRTFRYQGERIIEFILSLVERNRAEIIVLSNVRKISPMKISRLESFCDRLVTVDKDILEKYSLPSYVSPDRAASILAARYLFKGYSCTICDFGTMLTTDFIDERGNYAGGCISPGCMTRFKSIHRYSKQLPLLDMPEENDEKGLSISSSICSGVISGIIFEIQGHICQNSKNVTVFTGGDANYFAKRMKNSIFVVCNLVLMGLALIATEINRNE